MANGQTDTRHKVFISYYHHDDQAYKDTFEKSFGHLFINKSVGDGDIDTDVSTEYVKRLIQLGYISDSSVIVVLIGPKTKCRKHVDWEISAALAKKVGGYSGLIGILLPTFQLLPNGNYSTTEIPERLADNVTSKYATVFTWDWVCQSDQRIKDAIEKAFTSRVSDSDKIRNSRLQMSRNTCS